MLMTNQKKQLFALTIGIFAAAWFFLRDSEEAKIREMLKELCQQGSLAAVEAPFERLARAKQLSSALGEEISATLNIGQEIREFDFTRSEAQQRILAARSQLSTLELTLSDIAVDVDSGQATVTAIGHALGSMPGAEGQFYEEHDLVMLLKPGQSRDWEIYAVESNDRRAKEKEVRD